MAKVDYGAVALIPKGDFDATAQYAVNDLVSYNGSSFIVKAVPPIGTLPTDPAYFTTNASGTAPATPSTVGTVKPDNSTIEVDNNGVISVKSEVLDRVSSSEQALTVNLLNPVMSDKNENGITITKNADKTYTIAGTYTGATTTTYLFTTPTGIELENGKRYKVVGIPTGIENLMIQIGTSAAIDSGDGGQDVISTPISGGIKLHIRSGFSAPEGITIKPMITTNLSATYDDYVPYSGSSGKLDTDYKTLSEKIGNVGNTDLQSQLNAATQSIAQNTTDIAANAAGIVALNTGLTSTSSRTVTVLNNFTIKANDYRCRETTFGFQFSATFIIPQLSSDTWYRIATFTSAFGNKYDDYIDAFVYDDGVWKKFSASVLGDGTNSNINVFLSSNMSGKDLSLAFYAGRAGQR